MAQTEFGKRLEETAETLRKVGVGLQRAIEADNGDMPRNLSELAWIAVTERLPSKFGHYPIIHSHKSFSGHLIRKQYYASYDPDDGMWHDLHVWDDTRWSKVVTHWFELPELSSQ